MTVTHRFINEGLYIPANATGLIIGTFPSVLIKQAKGDRPRERDVNFYYGSKDNFFWNDLEGIYKKDFKYDWTDESVLERKKLLDDLHLGITDIILRCETEGGAADNALKNCVINEGLIKILEDNSNIKTIFFTSGSGKNNSDSLTLKLLSEKKRISKVRIIQKQNPKIRTFIFDSSNGLPREIKSITLYSPSPSAKRGGVTDEKRQLQYKSYLPALNN